MQDCFSISKCTKDLEILGNPRLKKWLRHKNFVIFGIGGSSLGGQCIHEITRSNNVRFAESLDPTTLQKMFSDINPDETGFLCISKSGETLETICQILLALDFIKEKEDKFVFITENKLSPLRKIANELNSLCIDHPKTIGGRFSVFSIVGMLPALICGVDPTKIRSGGKQILENHLEKIEEGSFFMIENFQKKRSQHVAFIYTDKLIKFGAWLAQLYAESTGKNGLGITPLTAIGTQDQHSQLQLYLDGNEDKYFTFFFENQESKSCIAQNKYLLPELSYLENKTTGSIFKAQYTATMTSLLEKKCSVRKIEVPEISPEVMGALFMHFMLEVVCVCKFMEVDPFSQPAVEYGKILAKKMLSESLC
ncbi:MAG: hypothetical protein LBB25_04110 [Holosporaceae bacterium]|nr:hypothetical protein [Holosporaceae bacterium]